MSISNYLENKLLDKVLRNTDFTVATVYVSLHNGDPGETGVSEIAGGSYARQSAAFDVAASGATQNTAQINFVGMPAVGAPGVGYIGLWDALAGGNFLWSGALAAAKIVNAGDTFRIEAADLDVAIE